MPAPTSAPGDLPRGRHAAPRAVLHTSQRERMLAAITSAVAEKGYAVASVGDVITRAGVSRKTFYEHFVDKEACFLAAYAWTVEQLLGEIEAAIEANPDPFAAAAAGIRAYLGFLAAHPAAARTFLIEVLAAGHEALERRSEVHQRFAEEHAAVHEAGRRLFEGVPPAPRHRLRACVGAIDALVTEHVRRYGAATVPQLAGQVLDVMLGLLVGDERAVVLQAELRRRAEEKSSGA